MATMPQNGVLLEFAVSNIWLCQVIVAMALICDSPYRGVVAFLRDLLGVVIGVGTVHDVLQSATRQASVTNRQPDLNKQA